MDFTEAEATAILGAYRQWLYKLAHEYSRDVTEVQDLAQEGHIAMWRALKTFDPATVKLATHLMNHARWRVIEVVTRGNYTGMESRAGRKHTAGTAKNRNREVPHDAGVSDFDALVEVDFDQVAWAYHYGQIYEAINRLPVQQRQRVYDRFWRGIYDPKNAAWWFGKRIGARDRLREHLEHLLEEGVHSDHGV